ncbi:hypothetical protein D3C80_858050 [compost metagenome]
MGVLGPETRVHVPVPITGVLAAIVAVVALQISWSGPALATVGGLSLNVMLTVSELG